MIQLLLSFQPTGLLEETLLLSHIALMSELIHNVILVFIYISYVPIQE